MHTHDQGPRRPRSRRGINDSKPETPIPANKIVTTTVGRLIFNDILPEGMPFYNLRPVGQGRQPRHRRLLQVPRPPGDHRPAGQHEGTGLQELHPRRSVVRHHRPAHPRPRSRRSSTPTQKKADRVEKNMSHRRHHRARTLQRRCWTSGPTPAKQVTKEMMDELKNDTPRCRRRLR